MSRVDEEEFYVSEVAAIERRFLREVV